MNAMSIPVIGHVLEFVFKVSVAIPFWICYTVSGLGEKYFSFLPAEYQSFGFWETVGLFIVLSVFGSIIKELSPFSFSVNNSNKDK
jgi:hypothetical protein